MINIIENESDDETEKKDNLQTKLVSVESELISQRNALNILLCSLHGRYYEDEGQGETIPGIVGNAENIRIIVNGNKKRIDEIMNLIGYDLT